MIVLILLSLFVPPQVTFADTLQQQNSGEEIDEFALEMQKENDLNVQQDTSQDKSSSNLVSSMLDEIELNEEDEAEEFVSDGKVQAILFEELATYETVDVIIRMEDSVDYNSLLNTALTKSYKEEKGEFVVSELQSVAQSSQTEILAELQSLESQNKVSNINQLWIINGISATVTLEALEKLAERNDVKRITHDFVVEAPDFQPEESTPRLPEWGLEKINAPQVWAEYGVKGEGIVVGIMDTGVQGDHDALKHNYRGRNGDHKYSWIDLTDHGYSVPTDGQGHGTHVAGTAVGGGEGEPIGVAPEAEWIAAKIFDDAGRSRASDIHEAFQWFMQPGGDSSMAPDVVNNSWGSADTYRTEFWEDVHAWIAAGIFPLFAAGNSGPGIGSMDSPGSYPHAFAVGATNRFDQIAEFSSRGPVYWENEYGEQIRYIKPEVSAPGQEIYSALPNGGYGLASGTSMATPHVAGAIALLLESDPDLSIPDITEYLTTTARSEESMGELPNEHYGHGIVNIYDAVTEAAFAGTLQGTLTNTSGESITGEIYLIEEDRLISVDESGTFGVKVREGDYNVEVRSFGYETLETEITVTRDETLDVSWQLQESTTFSVSGNVSFSDGNSVPYAYIRVQNTPLNSIRTDENGEFSIPVLPEGDYTFVITGNGVKPHTEKVTVDENLDVNIHVEQLEIEANEDWPTARNNFTRNPVANVDISIDHLVQSWDYETTGEVLFSTPIIAEGKVVLTTEFGNIIVIDQETGEEQWSLRAGRTNRSTPTVVDGVVYVAGGSDQAIHALDLESGSRIWSASVEYPAVYETPVYHDGVVYVSSHMDTDAKLTAINAETGDILWKREVGHGSFYGPTLADDKLFVSSYDSRELRALSIEDGEEIWTTQFVNQGISSSVVYNNGTLYVVTNNFNQGSGSLRAIDANTGEELWSNSEIGNAEAGSPIVFDELVIIGSSTNPVLKAFDTNSGELVWEENHGGLMVNTGAVSSNGYLFTTDLSGTLKIYDVYTGKRLNMISLTTSSTTGVALSEGQVVVADRNGVYSYTANGQITGTVVDDHGNPLGSSITIEELEKTVQADEQGQFALEARPGTYTLKVSYYGYKQVLDEINLVSGYEVNRSYELEEAELGSVTGVITDNRTGEVLEDVKISIPEANLETSTNNDGEFNIPEVYEGLYDIVVSKEGYADLRETITIEPGETTHFTTNLAPIDVVVLHDYEGEIVRLLTSFGINAEEKGWEAIDDLSNYEIAYLNGSYTSGGPIPTEEHITGIIEAAKEHDVSLVFADTWGPSYGSLRYLHQYTNDPANYDSYQRATSGSVQIRADQEHPIVQDLEIGRTYTAIDNSHLAWFSQYSGRELATVGPSAEGFQGSGIAYKGMTENSAHVLLSTHSASPWTSPYNGWTSIQQQILINSIEYLLEDLQFGVLSGQITDSDGQPMPDVKVEVSEHGYYVTTDQDGRYELFYDEGTNEVTFSKLGYSTVTTEVEFSNGNPVEENVVMEISTSGTVTGQVVNKLTNQPVPYAEIKLYNEDGTPVEQEIVSDINGNYEISNLNEGVYLLEVQERGYVYDSIEVYVGNTPLELIIELYPSPEVAIIGDTVTTNGSLRQLLEEYGIDANRYTGMEDVIPIMDSLDVVFYMSETASRINLELFDEFKEEADSHNVSIIYTDNQYSTGAINHLNSIYNDPEERGTANITSSSAGYVVLEENPIFGDASAGEFIEVLVPNRSHISYFEEYSGYPLAEIRHADSEEIHGLGVAYKPLTAESMEVLMSAHGVQTLRRANEYTDAGQDMFINAILWASYTEFSEISGNVVDENGDPLHADIEITNIGRNITNNPDTGYFSFGSVDGEIELKVSAFGYKDHVETVNVTNDLEPLHIQMELEDNIGSITGMFTDEDTLEGISGALVEITDYPREAVTNISGYFEIDRLLPGTYELVVSRDGYVLQEIEVEVNANENTEINRTMKPSPTIGVIVDAQSSGSVTLDEYLTERGYIVEHLLYDELERISAMDLIIANSDYNNNLIPEEDEFIEFLKELDRSEIPVIWTGGHGGRGSIRFLNEYTNNPAENFSERLPTDARDVTIKQVSDHPILENVKFDENDEFVIYTENYQGFDGYRGETILTSHHDDVSQTGSFVAVGGRTINSTEVLLSTMTFGFGFTNYFDERRFFDREREIIYNNAILWALDNEEALVGEVHGLVTNDLGQEVYANVSVEEINYSIQTERDGTFFLGLDDGTYTLNIEAFGHEAETFTVNIERGIVTEETFTLTADSSGIIKGQVMDIDTGEAVSDARMQLVGTPIETISDEEGNFELNAPASNYQLRVVADGYRPEVLPVNVGHNETTEIEVLLSESQKIAFVSTSINANRIIPFLEESGYEVDAWAHNEVDELIDVVDDYPLIIFNDRHTSVHEELFTELIETTDEKEISIIFPSQWNGGTIRDLTQFYNDPESVSSSFVPDHVNYKVLEEHPIFSGFEVGDEIEVLAQHGSNVQYMVFENYSGNTIADITNYDERVGGGLAYDFRSANSVHVLLGGLQVGSYGRPDHRWTEDAMQIYLNAIDWAMTASLGEIRGTVYDDLGEPLPQATVSIEDEDIVLQTNQEGKYSIGLGLGTYEVKVNAHGFAPETKEVTIENLGDVVELDFNLVQSERATLAGQVLTTNNEGIENATLTLTHLDSEEVYTKETDTNGNYEFNDLIAGDYHLELVAYGYQIIQEEITINEGEHHTKDFRLSDYNIAILGDFKGELIALFDEYDFAAQERDWDIVDDVYNYDVIVVNTSGTVDQLAQLIKEADEYETSIVFTDSWSDGGSIGALEEVLGYNIRTNQGYNEGAVYINPLEDHSIFEFNEDDLIRVFTEASPYSTFTGYEGRTLAHLVVNDEDQGAMMAYEFRSKNHMHLLLSSFLVNNIIGPERGWTEDGKQLFVNAVEWARDGVQELPKMPEWTVEDVVYSSGSIELTGISEYPTEISVLSDGNEVSSANTQPDGTFTVDVSSLEDGVYDLTLQASNFAGTVTSDKVIQLVVDTNAPEVNVNYPTDNLVTNQEVILVEGTATDDYFDQLIINDENVEVVDDSFSHSMLLTEGDNTIKITATDLAGNVTTIERTVTLIVGEPIISELEPSNDLYVFPGDEIEVSFTGTEGGQASFTVQLPMNVNTNSNNAIEMEEYEPGKYRGTWTIPSNTNLQGAIISVELEDQAGNRTTATASGKLFISTDNIDRIKGSNRYGTAIEISKTGWSQADVVILARGDDYADAIVGVPLAHKLDAPILLSQTHKISDETLSEIDRLGAEEIIVLGGSVAIDDSVVKQLEDKGLEVRRISGSNRFETATEIAKEISTEEINRIVVANGMDFPDAISVATHAAREGLPIVLTLPDRIPEATQELLEEYTINETIVIGGDLVVNDEIIAQLPSANRISGKDRYETNIKVNEYFGVVSKHLYVATGQDFADALTGAVLAAKTDSSIVLVHRIVPEVVANYLTSHGTKQISIFGGHVAVSDEIYEGLVRLLD